MRRDEPSSGGYAKSNPFRFSTKYTDEETGLVYYGKRYYSPASGCFVNRDPIEEAGGVNLHAFCGNNPINGYDVLGMSPPPAEHFNWLGQDWVTTRANYERNAVYFDLYSNPHDVGSFDIGGLMGLATEDALMFGGYGGDPNIYHDNSLVAQLQEAWSIQDRLDGAVRRLRAAGYHIEMARIAGRLVGLTIVDFLGHTVFSKVLNEEKGKWLNNAPNSQPQIGDVKLVQASVGVSTILLGDPGQFDLGKAAVVNFVEGFDNELSPYKFIGGVLNPFALEGLSEKIDIAFDLGDKSGGKVFAGPGDAAGNVMDQFKNVLDRTGPYQAFTVVQTATYTETTTWIFFTTNKWVNNPAVITPVNNTDFGLGGTFIDPYSAARAAAVALKKQISQPRRSTSGGG